MRDEVGILIIFFNKLAQTIECIDSFLPSGQQIYVLNNASDEKSWKIIEERYVGKKVALYRSAENLGPSRGRNVLLSKCVEDWVFIVDNDTRIQPAEHWKSIFDKQTALLPDARLFAPAIFNVHDNEYAVPHHFSHVNGEIHMAATNDLVTNHFSCCGVIIHKDIFSTYGNFDNQIVAFEDYEFSIRALLSAAGALNVFPLPGIELIHDHRVQHSWKDKKSVLERYNEQKISASLQRIQEKHKVSFVHNWEWWTRKQVAEMTGGSFLQKVKRIARKIGI